MLNRRVLFGLLTVFSATLICSAQQPAPAPQTARQALIEMFTGGEKAFSKHLTVEVQQLLKKPEYKRAAAMMGMYSAASHTPGIQFFENGPVLVSVDEPGEHTKFEVRVDGDDLSGEEDTLTLSPHTFKDGQEQDVPWGFFLFALQRRHEA